jgi:hypothetical protein
MEQIVFTNDSIKNILVENFVSVRMQFDSTLNDDSLIKKMYAEVGAFKSSFNITEYPTYLFFDHEGNFLYKDVGFKDRMEFKKTIEIATDPNRQYFALLKKFREGTIDNGRLTDLAFMALNVSNDSVANEIAKHCLNTYFDTISTSGMLAERNLDFLTTFRHLINSRQNIFIKLCSIAEAGDSLTGFNDTAEELVLKVLFKEKIQPLLNIAYEKNNAPNWNKLYRAIKKEYGSKVANKSILEARLKFYEKKKNWKQFLKLAIAKIKATDPSKNEVVYAINVNTTSWLIFLHSENKRQIKLAIDWMKNLVVNNTSQPGWLDTYANLLYKSGNKKEALKWEEMAFKLSPNDHEIESALLLMKLNKPTWKK